MNKVVRSICCLCFFTLALLSAEAQYNRAGQLYGRPNSVIPRSSDPKEEAKPMTAEEIVASEMPKFTEAANLNDFEQAVVSSVLTKHIQQTIELKLLELEPQKTREYLEQIRKSQNEELKAGLPEEKYNILMEIQEKGFKKVKADQKKKKKKKKKSS